MSSAEVDALQQYGLNELLRLRLIKEVIVAVPAPGAEFTQTVPAGVIWELLSVQCSFTSSAIVAARVPSLRVRDSDGLVTGRWSIGSSQAASLTIAMGWFAGLGANVTNNGFASVLPNPPFACLPGWVISTSTTLIDVGDQYSIINMLVREWSVDNVHRQSNWIGNQLGVLADAT